MLAGVGLVACAAVVAACGGSSDNDNDKPALSKSAFVAKADAVCDAVDKQFPPVKVTDLASSKRSLQVEIAARSKINSQIGALNAPDNLSDLQSQFADAGDKIVALLRQEQDQVGKNNQAYYRANFELNELIAKRSKMAARLGFQKCAAGQNGPVPMGDASLVAQADAICRTANKAILDNTIAGPPSGDLATAKASYDKYLPQVQGTVDAMKEIKPPAQYAQDWKQFVSNYERRAEITAKQREAAAAGDQKAFQKWSSLDQGESGIETQVAIKLGLEVCGNNGTAGV
jgi:hypothetical protein